LGRGVVLALSLVCGREEDVVAALNDVEQSEVGLEANFDHCTSKFRQEGIPKLVSLEQNGREYSTHGDRLIGLLENVRRTSGNSVMVKY